MKKEEEQDFKNEDMNLDDSVGKESDSITNNTEEKMNVLEEMLAEFNEKHKSSADEDDITDKNLETELDKFTPSEEKEACTDNDNKQNPIQEEEDHTEERKDVKISTGEESSSAQDNSEKDVILSTNIPLSCPQCDYKSGGKNPGVAKQTLKQHIKGVHEKVKDHQCKFCDYATSQRSNLNTHMKRKHNQE